MKLNEYEVVRTFRSHEIAERYNVSRATAHRWIRKMIRDGVCRRIGKYPAGRPCDVDAWVANGGRR